MRVVFNKEQSTLYTLLLSIPLAANASLISSTTFATSTAIIILSYSRLSSASTGSTSALGLLSTQATILPYCFSFRMPFNSQPNRPAPTGSHTVMVITLSRYYNLPCIQQTGIYTCRIITYIDIIIHLCMKFHYQRSFKNLIYEMRCNSVLLS